MPQTFKSLPIGAEFEFDHATLPVSCGGMAHGPWVKISARKYAVRLGDSHGRHGYVIGSINAEVRTDGTCGMPDRLQADDTTDMALTACQPYEEPQVIRVERAPAPAPALTLTFRITLPDDREPSLTQTRFCQHYDDAMHKLDTHAPFYTEKGYTVAWTFIDSDGVEMGGTRYP